MSICLVPTHVLQHSMHLLSRSSYHICVTDQFPISRRWELRPNDWCLGCVATGLGQRVGRHGARHLQEGIAGPPCNKHRPYTHRPCALAMSRTRPTRWLCSFRTTPQVHGRDHVLCCHNRDRRSMSPECSDFIREVDPCKPGLVLLSGRSFTP